MGTVTVTDAGPNLLLAGPTEDAVLAEVLERERLGFRRNAAPQRLGQKWVVTVAKPEAPDAEVTIDACTLERIGLRVIVRGPTEEAVRAKVENLRIGGATLIDRISYCGREWAAVLDAPR